MVHIDIKSAVPWLTVRRRPASTAVQTIIGKDSMDFIPFQLRSRIWHYPTNQSLFFVLKRRLQSYSLDLQYVSEQVLRVFIA